MGRDIDAKNTYTVDFEVESIYARYVTHGVAMSKTSEPRPDMDGRDK